MWPTSWFAQAIMQSVITLEIEMELRIELEETKAKVAEQDHKIELLKHDYSELERKVNTLLLHHPELIEVPKRYTFDCSGTITGRFMHKP